MQRLRPLIAAWLLLLLCVPGAAWLLGARQPVLENQPKALFPPINRSTLPSKETYPRFEAAFLDRLPFRDTALEARGRIDVQLFGDTTNPAVQLGKDGWLFYGPDTQACTPAGAPSSDPVEALDVVSRSIIASGRRGGILLAGSKTIAMRDRLGGAVPAAEVDCAARLERAVQERLRASPGGFDIQGELDAVRAKGTPTFLKYDTHWTPASRMIFLRAVLDRVRPGLADRARLYFDPKVMNYAGDLGRFLGIPYTDPVRTIGARPLPAPAPGSVAFVGDSQLNFSLAWPGPDGKTVAENALPGSPVCAVEALGNGGCDGAITQSRTLVMEMVARNVNVFTAACWRPISLMMSDRAGQPARWQTAAGTQPGALRTTQATTTVGLRSSSADRSDLPRLFRFPIQAFPKDPGTAAVAVDLTQTPGSGDPIPCLTPQQVVEGGALFVPLPAGRSAADLSVDVKAPVGTVLGRPEEIILDGATAPRKKK